MFYIKEEIKRLKSASEVCPLNVRGLAKLKEFEYLLNLAEKEVEKLNIPAISSNTFDMETNFITCKCEGELQVYPHHLDDGGYDWCKKCNCPVGSDK